MKQADLDKLFVYGTLTRRSRPVLRYLLKEKLRFLGRGRIQGTLYDVGEYPGAVRSKTGFVHGEVFEIKDFDILKRLDAYEEYDARRPSTSLFRREAAEVLMDHGVTMPAMVYFYNKNPKGLPRIPSGLWHD
jgi:gamma-glutamylcyclotransferase (GGCT)/AIG2-like uncharacterized protein YtfP